MPYTSGFKTIYKLRSHFQSHGSDFAAVDDAAYLHMADTFLGVPKTMDMLECIRSNGDRVRYNKVTFEFGVVDRDNFIRTYYKRVTPSVYYPTAEDFMREKCR